MRFLLSAILLCAFNLILLAQPKQNSAYSRFGIGDILPQYYANQAGWGGMTAAFHDPYHLNPSNPASYAFLRTTTLETGMYAKNSNYTSGSVSYTNWSGNLAYLSLGFTLNSPINEVLDKVKSPWRYGMGVSLSPYSIVGYNTTATKFSDNLGKITNSYKGSGGIYKLAWSGAAKYKNASVGLTLGWAFGKSLYETSTDFDASNTYSYLNNIRNSIRVHGLTYNAGFQQDFVLDYFETDKSTAKRWITVGFTASGNQKLNLDNESIFIRSRGTSAGGTLSYPDTIENFTGKNALKQKLTLPGAFTVGILYVNTVKFKVGLNAGYERWQNYRNEARPEKLRNTVQVSTGIEYIPNALSYNRYFKRVRYRTGLFYKQDPRVFEGKNMDNYGVTMGFGFPITLPRQQTSFVNLAFELGVLGPGTVIEEKYGKITVGFTLNDNTWFFKRRFE